MSYATFKNQLAPKAGQSLGFRAGKGYYLRGKPRAAAAPAPQDPFAPMTPQQIRQQITARTSSLPAGLSEPQIQSRAQGMLDPIVQRITAAIAARAKAGGDAVSGYTGELAKNLGAEVGNVHNAYAPSEESVAAANAAFADRLSGAGAGQADALAARLASIGSPDVSGAAAGQVRAAGDAAGNAAYGVGQASLQQMLTNEGSAKGYAGKLPALARLTGLQRLSEVQQQANHDTADQTGQVMSQLPTLIQNLRSSSDTNRANRAQLADDTWKYLTSRNDAIAAGTQKNAATVQAANTRAAATVTAAKVKAASAKEANAAKAAQTNFNNRIKFAKAYGYDPVTGQTLPGFTRANGKVVKVATSSATGSKKKGQLTENQIVKLVRQWHDGTPQSATVPQYQTDDSGKPVTDDKGNKIPVKDNNGAQVYKTVKGAGGQLKYNQAYAMLRAFGKGDAEARRILNTVYARGDNGRAWVTNEVQAALGRAGLPTRASLVNGREVLKPNQVAALKKAGVAFPAGQLTAEGFYVISPGY